MIKNPKKIIDSHVDRFQPTHKVAERYDPILKKGELFCLKNKHYVNEDESVSIKSNNTTGKIFTKI